ncbi:MAG: Bug family tripartite tricarboxylate transporter substrate binding protein [Pigmentiphaga sp.]
MTSISRRQCLGFASAAVAAAAWPVRRSIAAELRQLQILVGISPGGVADTVARVVAEGLPADLAETALVENRTGAGGQLVLNALRQGPQDGSMLVMTPASQVAVYPHTYPNLQYDPLKDFSPVSVVGIMEFGLAVGPLVPEDVKTVDDFIQWCAANPDLATFGSPAAGSIPHFLGELLGKNGGVDLVHVPYRGTQPAIADLIGGQIAAVSGTIGGLAPFAEQGRIRVLATSGPERSRFLKNVPTYTEQGYPDLELVEWLGLFAPAGVPPERLERISQAVAPVLLGDRGLGVLATSGIEPRGSTPQVLDEWLAADYARWKPIVESVGFQAL